MPPLDALTQARIRSLEIVLAWLIEQSFDVSDPHFVETAFKETYIMDLADKIRMTPKPEEEDD